MLLGIYARMNAGAGVNIRKGQKTVVDRDAATGMMRCFPKIPWKRKRRAPDCRLVPDGKRWSQCRSRSSGTI